MRNTITMITACALMSGAVFAQETSKSVENILNELTSYTGEPVPAVDPLPEVREEFSAAEQFVEIPVAAIPAAEISSELLMDEWPEPVADSEIVRAQEGFKDMTKLAPEKLTDRMYHRTPLERDHRTAEVSGMKAVDAAWSTDLTFRSYALGDDAREKMGLENVENAVEVKSVFPQVDFPKGSSAIYQPKMETLFVRNTRENLAVLEAILEAMDLANLSTDVDQVEIEAKFVEVSEGTLEELGFQWNFDDPVGIGGTDVDVNDGPGGLFSDALRGSPSGSSPGLPFTRPGSLGEGVAAATGGWSTFRFEDTFNTQASDITLEYRGGNPVEVLISALDQSTGADVLSAPRVVTRSGEEATIRVGELHYYPETYEGDSAQSTILNVSYEDFEEKLLGVELSVTPEVDGDQIELELNPRISELIGWQNYQLAPANSLYNHRQLDQRPVYAHAAIVARLPIFKKREITTIVTIADGSTISMGGLMSEKIEAFEDAVPVLGHIPLLGRLFRNEGERAVKRNLLMFVTAKKVEPSGRINTSRLLE
ncbi:MAG: hypothetical protein JEZ10_08300 [Verrucomicrobia bacterium]|nr:hypothetical protein [Verrucomicrobiota bacterium]